MGETTTLPGLQAVSTRCGTASPRAGSCSSAAVLVYRFLAPAVTHIHMTDNATQTDESTINSLADPEAVLDREDVLVEATTRTLDPEKFAGLEERYDAIEGVVQMGLLDDEGRLLLQGWDGASAWAPPGGSVVPGQDWAAAARESMEALTGISVRITEIALVEELTFELAGGDDSFSAYGVSFTVTSDRLPEEFLDDPTFDAESPLAEEEMALGWFTEMPDDVNENHIRDVELWLDDTDT